jgi:hypothetical protein
MILTLALLTQTAFASQPIASSNLPVFDSKGIYKDIGLSIPTVRVLLKGEQRDLNAATSAVFVLPGAGIRATQSFEMTITKNEFSPINGKRKIVSSGKIADGSLELVIIQSGGGDYAPLTSGVFRTKDNSGKVIGEIRLNNGSAFVGASMGLGHEYEETDSN